MVTVAQRFAGAPTSPGLRSIIKSFGLPYRRLLWHFTTHGTNYTDLLTSFPAAALALATMPAAHPVRERAMQLVARGAPLRSLARTLQLPYWYRRLPAAAFSAPPVGSPDTIDDDEFGAQILNLVPHHPAALAGWLGAVTTARVAGGDDFALWIGALPAVRASRAGQLPVRLLALHQWHTCRPPLLAGGPSAGALRRDRIRLARATSEARHWLIHQLRELCHCELSPDCGSASSWQSQGLSIVPLATHAAIIEEAAAMHNCLARYVNLVAWGHCRLFSVRCDSERLATFELRRRRGGAPYLRQLRGPHNLEAPATVLSAVRAWIRLEDHFIRRNFKLDFGEDAEARFEQLLWGPFAEHVQDRASPAILTTTPSIADILRDADALEACATSKPPRAGPRLRPTALPDGD